MAVTMGVRGANAKNEQVLSDIKESQNVMIDSIFDWYLKEPILTDPPIASLSRKDTDRPAGYRETPNCL